MRRFLIFEELSTRAEQYRIGLVKQYGEAEPLEVDIAKTPHEALELLDPLLYLGRYESICVAGQLYTAAQAVNRIKRKIGIGMPLRMTA